MAYDRIEPPDLWQSTTARLLYQLVCSWSSGKTPTFAQFLPPSARPQAGPMDESQILSAFGFKTKD
jgi:hypothetical protein